MGMARKQFPYHLGLPLGGLLEHLVCWYECWNSYYRLRFMYRFTAAVAEMLFQSDESNLYLLPALPSMKWRDGLVVGLQGKGAVTVGFRWIGGKLEEVTIQVGRSRRISQRRGCFITMPRLSHYQSQRSPAVHLRWRPESDEVQITRRSKRRRK